MRGQALVKAFVPLPGSAQAIYTTAGLQHYRRPDWLGSSRLSTTTTAGAKYYDVEYAPYGENYGGTTGTGGAVDLTFTGQNQDTVTTFGGLYDFLYREYNPVQGRWISPDPAGRGAANPADPQSWNRYAYVGNSPLGRVDAQGLDWGDWGGGWGDGGWGGDVWSEQLPIYTGPPLDPSWIIWNLHKDDQTGLTVGDLGDTNCSILNGDQPCTVWDPIQQLWDNAPARSGDSVSAAPQKPWYENSCITDALGDAALHAGIDAIGLIPEAGGIARIIGHGAGFRGVVADQLGHKVIDALGKSTGGVTGLAGLGDTSPEGLASTALTIAGFVPVLGTAASIGSILLDTYKAAKAIGQCN